jgi:hypothetical protein
MTKELAKLESTLADAKHHEARLAADLNKAQEALNTAVEARRNALLDEGTDTKAFATAESKAAQAERMLAAVADAASVAKARADAAEQQLSDAKEQGAREKRASELRAQAAAIEAAHLAVVPPLEKLAAALKAAPSVFQAIETATFLETFVPQIATSITSTRAELEQQAAIALSGSQQVVQLRKAGAA